MSTWDKVKEDLEEGVLIAKKGAKFIADKAVTETEIMRLKMSIKSIDKEIFGLYADIGEAAYEEFMKKKTDLADNITVNEAVSKISKLLYEKDRLEGKIEVLKRNDAL